MKLIKLIFNRFIIIALVLILELVLIITSVMYFDTFFNWFRISSYIISILVFLHLVNRKQNPELKLPWLFFLLTLPFVSSIMYIMLTNSKMTRKQFKNYKDIYNNCLDYLPNNLKNHGFEKSKYWGQDKYLSFHSHTTGSANCEVKYFSNGMLFFEDLLNELNNAKKFIFMEYFIINTGYMWEQIHNILIQKVKTGVEVKILYDDMGTMGRLMSGYYRKLRKEGIDARKFNKFTPVISGLHNNRDHRKLTIIDGIIGYTGGINLSDEYINKIQPYGVWKDCEIKVKGSDVANMTMMFLQMFDIESKHRINYSKYLDIEYPKYQSVGFVHSFGSGPAPFYREQVGENNFINMLSSATECVYITTPYLIIDYYLKTSLKMCAERGVDVRIITPHIPDKKMVFSVTRSNYKDLLESGVKIYEYAPGFIHSKQVIVDRTLAFVGTINFDYRSLVHHYECGTMLYNVPCIDDIEKDFKNTIDVSIEVTKRTYKMNKIIRLYNACIALFVSLL